MAKRKDKTAAALLAIFGGALGIHRFYTGQVGLGILYIFLPGAWLLSLIDATIFLTQDEDKFDYKYNRDLLDVSYNNNYETDFNRRRREERRRKMIANEEAAFRAEQIRRRKTGASKKTTNPKRANPKTNPHKLKGIEKYKEYDFEESIEEFKKSLQIYYPDVAVHFNLACAYSITEEVESALFHLDKSVEYGFVDFKKIKEHDALAFLRIQAAFDQFSKNGYRLTKQPAVKEMKQSVAEPQKIVGDSTDLLEQLRKLGELKERGLLTEEEFQLQKEKLLK